MEELFYCRLRGKTKIPMEKDFINKATDDRNIVKEWLANGDNIGVVCVKSGIVVVDIDVKHGGVDAWAALCMEHGEPKTRTQITPSGGRHYLFKARQGVRYRGKIQNGIDIRHNHQIVVAPSSIGAKSYSWIDRHAEIIEYPDWLRVLIESPSKKTELLQVSNEYLMALAREIRKFDLSYDEWATVGMAIHSSDPSPVGLHAFIEASMGPSYQDGDEEKCADKWNSFHTDRDVKITIRSLTHLIREKGGIVPPTCSSEDFDKVNSQREGWVEEGGKYITFSMKDCVDKYNERHRFFTSGGEACVIRMSEVPDTAGKLREVVNTLSKKAFLVDAAPYVYRVQKKKQVIDTNAGLIWIEDRRRKEIDRIVFAPTCGERELNLFKGMPTFEVNDEPRAVLDLLTKSLVISERERKWLLKWLAHIIQHPWNKSSLVPVHITKEGTGKGILYDMVMREILGEYFFAVGQTSELVAGFNKHLANKLLTFVDESSWRGDKTAEGVLKKLTGSDKLTIEEKFGATYEISNPSRYVVASNHDDAVCIGSSNRRYVLLRAGEALAGDSSFFHPIADAVRQGKEAEKFGAYLSKLDVSDFSPFLLPDFRNGEDAKFKSLGAIGEFWQEVATGADFKLWSERGLVQRDTFEAFCRWKKETSHWEKSVTPHSFWKRTQEITMKMEPKPVRLRETIKKVYDIEPKRFFELMMERLKIDITLRPQSEYYDDADDF